MLLWDVRPELKRQETQHQDSEASENSRPHAVVIDKSLQESLHTYTETELHLRARKLQCKTPHANQDNNSAH